MVVIDQCIVCGSSDSSPFFEFQFPWYSKDTLYKMRKCNNCGMLFYSPRMEADEINGMYDEDYYVFKASDGEQFEKMVPMYRRTASLVEEQVKVKKVLEIGCARGHLLALMKSKGWDVKGVEIASNTAKYANDKLGVDVFNGTIEDFSANQSDTYDLVLAIDVLEHVPNPTSFIESIAKLHCSGDVLVIDTPNGGSANIDSAKGNWVGFNPFHIFLYNHNNLRSLLEKSGYDVISVFSYNNKRYQARTQKKVPRIVKIIPYKYRVLLCGFFCSLISPCRVLKAKLKILQRLDYFDSKDSNLELSKSIEGDNIVLIAKKR